jgi:hypothetical protein
MQELDPYAKTIMETAQKAEQVTMKYDRKYERLLKKETRAAWWPTYLALGCDPAFGQGQTTSKYMCWNVDAFLKFLPRSFNKCGCKTTTIVSITNEDVTCYTDNKGHYSCGDF